MGTALCCGNWFVETLICTDDGSEKRKKSCCFAHLGQTGIFSILICCDCCNDGQTITLPFMWPTFGTCTIWAYRPLATMTGVTVNGVDTPGTRMRSI